MLRGHLTVAVPRADWRFQDIAERRVAYDKIEGVEVSTVFLGLDHGRGDGPPLLFETMIFGGTHDGYQERYSSWAQAEEGHAEALALARAALGLR